MDRRRSHLPTNHQRPRRRRQRPQPNHFSEWRKGGYEEYLHHQEWRDQLRILRENGSDMSELTDGPKFQETLVQIALTEIFRVLQQRELKPDSLNYIRLFNALARLNREALSLRKYNDQLAKEEAALKQLDPKRKLSENEHRAIADIIDQVMEMPHPLWSAPAERSGDGAMVDSIQSTDPKASPPDLITPTPTRTPTHTSSFPEVGRDRQTQPGLPAAPLQLPGEPATSICPSSPSSPSSPLPSRPCRTETPESPRMVPLSASGGEGQGEVALNTPQIHQSINPISERCLDCGALLPVVPPHSLRRPEDHCPSCGMRLPDIGLCYQPGFDHCMNCDATQPALLPGGERPRPFCHKCGERLHNPEPPTA